MYCLEQHEIAIIEKEIARAEINYSHLPADLLDHLCCDVEHVMWEEQVGFLQAWKRVKSLVGIKGLQKIQQETLFLNDNQYKTMKTLMKISGIAATFLLTLASYFKIMHWPGAAIGLMLGFVILCLLFFPSAVYTMYRENKSGKQILLHLSGLLGGVGYSLAVLWKIMHWPGANILMLGAMLVINLVFLPTLLFVKLKENPGTAMKLIIIIGLLGAMAFFTAILFKMFHWPGASILLVTGGIAIVLLFVPLYSVKAFWKTAFVDGRYIFLLYAVLWIVLTQMLLRFNVGSSIKFDMAMQDQGIKTEQMIFQDASNQIFDDSILTKQQNDQLGRLHQLNLEIQATSIEIKRELVKFSGKENLPAIFSDGDLNSLIIMAKSNREIPREVLFGQNRIEKLEEQLSAFNKGYSRITGEEIPFSLLNTSEKSIHGQPVPWRYYHFYNKSMIAVINILDIMNRELGFVEQQLKIDLYHEAKKMENNKSTSS